MAYIDQAALALNPQFRERVRIAIVAAARDIQGEDKGSMSDERFAKRQSLAAGALEDGGASEVEAFSWAVAASPAITDASTDSDIQFTINSVWDDVAQIRSTD